MRPSGTEISQLTIHRPEQPQVLRKTLPQLSQHPGCPVLVGERGGPLLGRGRVVAAHAKTSRPGPSEKSIAR